MPIKTSSPFTQMNLPVLNARPAQPIEIDYKCQSLELQVVIFLKTL